MNWLNKMRHLSQRICGEGVVGRKHTETDASNGTYWSGYDATNGGFNYANADWQVPCYSGSNSKQLALEWVGIGGDSGTHLFQAGTESDYPDGYRFWWEDVPRHQSIVYAGPSVYCGNKVNSYVSYNYDVAGQAYLWMYNYQNGQYWSYADTASFIPGSNSAEWIVERPACQTGNYALAPISNVNWTNGWAGSTTSDNDLAQSIEAFAPEEPTIVQNGVLLSDNSGIGYDGESFTTYYHASGVSYC